MSRKCGLANCAFLLQRQLFVSDSSHSAQVPLSFKLHKAHKICFKCSKDAKWNKGQHKDVVYKALSNSSSLETLDKSSKFLQWKTCFDLKSFQEACHHLTAPSGFIVWKESRFQKDMIFFESVCGRHQEKVFCMSSGETTRREKSKSLKKTQNVIRASFWVSRDSMGSCRSFASFFFPSFFVFFLSSSFADWPKFFTAVTQLFSLSLNFCLSQTSGNCQCCGVFGERTDLLSKVHCGGEKLFWIRWLFCSGKD